MSLKAIGRRSFMTQLAGATATTAIIAAPSVGEAKAADDPLRQGADAERLFRSPRGMSLAHDDEHGKGEVKELSQRDIAEKLDGKKAKATMVEVTLAPGQVEAAHRHPGPAFGYILEGEYEWAIDDNEAKIRPVTPSTSRPAACTASEGIPATRTRHASSPSSCTRRTPRTSSSPKRRNSEGKMSTGQRSCWGDIQGDQT
jgi:hypothetical protein